MRDLIRSLVQRPASSRGSEVGNPCGNRYSEETKLFCAMARLHLPRKVYRLVNQRFFNNALAAERTARGYLGRTFVDGSESSFLQGRIELFVRSVVVALTAPGADGLHKQLPEVIPFAISVDATSVTGAICWARGDDTFVGFMPENAGARSRKPLPPRAYSADEWAILSSLPRAKNLCAVVLSCPIATVHPRCVAAFAEGSFVRLEDVFEFRWKPVLNALAAVCLRVNVRYVSVVCSDGEQSSLSHMKPPPEWRSIISDARSLSNAVDSVCAGTQQLYMQDCIHIVTKIRMRLMSEFPFPCGRGSACAFHLREARFLGKG